MSEVKRYSAQPFSPNGLMFENEFGHYVLFCEYEKLKAENNRLQEQIVYTVDAIKEDMNENSETITKLTLQRDIMKKALEFYADGNNWSTINHMASVVTYDRLEYDKDLGDGAFQINEETNDKDVSGMRARKALQEAEQE